MRINLVEPRDLADQHLFAEWRELKMAPQMLRRSLRTKSSQSIQARIGKQYTLNKGHGLFIYDKMQFLAMRFAQLTTELGNRSYNLSPTSAHEIFFEGIPVEFKSRLWSPTKNEVAINVERIVQRLNERPAWYRYYGEIKPPPFFEALYTTHLMQFSE